MAEIPTGNSSSKSDPLSDNIAEELAELRRKTAEQESLLSIGERQRQALQQQLELQQHSLSWRLTSPLRRLGDWLGRRAGLRVAARQSAASDCAIDYQEWLDRYDTLTEADLAAIGRHSRRLAAQPLISVVLPVHCAREQHLRRAVASVRAQLYSNWELCIVADVSSAAYSQPFLTELPQQDARIRVVSLPVTEGEAVATNHAFALVAGEFTTLLDPADTLAPHALYLLAIELNRCPAADILYSDEDCLDDDGHRSLPQFKPDWNPDLFLSCNYLSRLTVFRTSLIRTVGGCRREVEGAHEYDLALRCIQHTTGERIIHIPAILCHRGSVTDVSRTSATDQSRSAEPLKKALMDYFAAEKTVVSIEGGNVPGTLVVSYPLPETAPLVSLIVPTRDGGKVLRSCLESIRGKTGYPNYEIIVVDNQSRDTATCDYLASLAGAGVVRLLHYDKPFNYSAINNFAVSQARGEIVGLLNDDLEVISPDWLTEMVRHALRPEIGAVGAMLYYPDRRIQHAGVILGLRGVAGHIGHGLLPEQVNYPERLGLVQNYSAVTAACLLVRKAVYQQIGGLDEQSLPVAYNDVDFCLRLGAAGYRNLWTPLAELYHHESVSRGYDETSDKKERWQRESLYMQKQWGRMINSDPCYNPNLTLAWPDCRVACPPRTAKPWVE